MRPGFLVEAAIAAGGITIVLVLVAVIVWGPPI